jgi:hypothetical protein
MREHIAAQSVANRGDRLGFSTYLFARYSFRVRHGFVYRVAARFAWLPGMMNLDKLIANVVFVFVEAKPRSAGFD